MGAKINPTKSSRKLQTIPPDKLTHKSTKTGMLHHWKVKSITLCKSLYVKLEKAFHLESFHKPTNIKITKSTHLKISKTANKSPETQQQIGVEHQSISKILATKPTTADEFHHLLLKLELQKKNLTTESSPSSQVMLKQINNRIDVIKKRLISTSSSYQECQLKRLEIKASLDLIKDKNVPNIEQVKYELNSLLQNLDNTATQASQSNQLTKNEKENLTNYPKTLSNIMKKTNLKLTVGDIKQSAIDRLNRNSWHEINKTGSFITNGKEYRFQQKSTPGCKITGSSETTRADSKEKVTDIFPEDYQGKAVTAHAIKNTTHATNLFTSRLINPDTGQEELAIVRHGVNSPYGLKPSKERSEGACKRTNEVMVSALSMKPELLKRAIQGEVVDLMVTSSSLLTPDSFRQLLVPLADEKPMLDDQLTAFQTLCREQPVTLKIKTADGQLMDIKVNLELIPFNIGVNKFAVGSSLSATGGWKYSDAVNTEGINRLIGSTTPLAGIGGIVGKWLRENKGHPDAEVVSVLAQQVQEIYSTQAYKTLRGGAYKLPARLIALTWLIGGVPCTNCKSGKDRTSFAVAAAEALIAYIRTNQEVPRWDTVDEEQSHIVKEFCFQGAHHDIQSLNSGPPGFKIDKKVLRGYGMTQFEIDKLVGLSCAAIGYTN